MELTSGIVCVLDDNNTPAGAGFVVSDGLIATCAHVLGETRPKQVVIVFQATNERREARVIDQCWRSEDAEDVAFLQVIGSLPLGVQPFLLATATGTRGHTIHTFGFPVAGEVDGVLGTGTVLGLGAQTKAGQPLLQVRSSEITSGFSGAPLWDESRQRVIGMVVLVAKPDESGKLGETAFATPTETLRMVCPMLRVSDLCPYRNLDAFTEADAAFFFGRERALDELLESLRNEPRFLAVFGPSGSGKSSVVQAGLVPLLRRGAIPGSSHWEIKFIRPVDNPFKALMVLHLVDESNDLIAGTRAWLSQNPKQSRLVLIIDQFEELFVSCSEGLREEFVAQLTKLLEGSAPLSVILTMRDDFYSYFIQYETLAKRLRRSLVNITPTLKREEITAIVEKPAQAVGFRFADGLVAAIVKEVLENASGVQGQEGRSTILPLLAFALTLLWEECKEEGVLTYEAYSKIGGVTGSLTQWADKVFFNIEDEDKRLLSRRIFTDLVYLGDKTQGRPDTRQRKPLDSLPHNEGEREKVLQLVQYFVQNRLLVVGRDIQTNEETVELIHEALIKEWGQLKWWLTEDNRFLVWQQKLKERIREWIETDVENPDKRDEYKLLGGRELTEAIEGVNDRSTDLSQLERDFIQRSKERQEQAAGHLQRLYDMALARQLAAQAELMRSQQANLLEQSVLLAVEAMRRFPSVEADVALRRGLALLPRSIATMEHTDSGRVITFSSDGKYIATGSTDGTAWVWETKTGREVLRIAHPGDVRAVSFSPDGTYLATASGDEAARLWEVTTGREVTRLPQMRVTVLAFSPDGNYLATAIGSSSIITYPQPKDYTARVWEVPTAREAACITHAGNVAVLAFSPDGKYLATGSDDGEAIIWDYTISREIVRSPHKGTVRALAFSPDGAYLATATGMFEVAQENTTLIWEGATGREVARMDQIGLVRALAFSPDGKYLATGSADGTARLWEVETSREVVRMPHANDVRVVAFSPDGKYLATGSADGTARLWRAETARWETETGRELTRMAHADAVTSLAFSPDGAYLATASWDHTAHVWSTVIGWEIAYLPHKHDLDAIAFSPDGTYLATTNVYETLIWEVATGREVVRIDRYYTGYVVAFSPDSRYLAIGGSGRISVLDPSNEGEAIFVRDRAGGRVTAIAFSPDGNYLAAGSDDGTVQLWEVATWQEVTHISHADDVDAIAIAFSPGGRYIATAGRKRSNPWEAVIIGRKVTHANYKPEDYFAVVWEVTTGHEVTRIINTGNVTSLSFSPDGKRLATAGGNRTAQVWEIATGQEVLHLAHEQQVLQVSHSPDGKYFATGSADGIARLWEAATGRELARIAHEKGVRAITFSPNGRYVATASQADAWVWLWRPEDLIAEACSRLTRNLTREEWRAYLGDEPYRKTCPNLP